MVLAHWNWLIGTGSLELAHWQLAHWQLHCWGGRSCHPVKGLRNGPRPSEKQVGEGLVAGK
jgi:hypothetical protein